MKYIIDKDKLFLEVTNENIESIINSTKRIIKKCDKNNLELVINYNDKNINESKINDLKMIQTAINIKDKEKRYNYIYDTVCNILDKRINEENYCEFENDVCIRFRKENPNHKNGCCEWKGRGKCKYLIKSECTMKSCMACKLFTCSFLYKTKKIRQKVDDYVLLKYFFNRNQKYILECSFWTPKEIVMKRLINNSMKPKE